MRSPGGAWRPNLRRRAFTLIEVISVLVILTIAVLLGYPKYLENVTHARNARAIGELDAMVAELQGYFADHGEFPTSLAGIGRNTLLDPWGNPYRYLSFATVPTNARGIPQGSRRDRFNVPINTYYDLYSMGEDGQTVASLTSDKGRNDVIVARDGGFIGLGWRY